jgi:nucleotide-binding universal stress UspA family protein
MHEEHTKQVGRRCREALEEIARKHLPDHSCELAVVGGRVADSIQRYALNHEQDLTVIASRGLSGFAHAVLGSVAERLVRCSEIPMVTLKVNDRQTGQGSRLPLSA